MRATMLRELWCAVFGHRWGPAVQRRDGPVVYTKQVCLRCAAVRYGLPRWVEEKRYGK